MQTQTPHPLPLLVVLDCDSTLIQDEVIELIAEAAGTREQVAAITKEAMRGEKEFSLSLAQRVATLEGTSDSVFAWAFEQLRVTPGAQELIDEVHARGGKVGVVSGGFHEVLDPLARSLEIDIWRANRLEVVDSKLTGKTVGAVIDGEAKAEALRDWAKQFGTELSRTVTIGDGANDIPMMTISGLSVAFNAQPVVREHADTTVENDLSRVIPLLDQFFPTHAETQ